MIIPMENLNFLTPKHHVSISFYPTKPYNIEAVKHTAKECPHRKLIHTSLEQKHLSIIFLALWSVYMCAHLLLAPKFQLTTGVETTLGSVVIWLYINI